MPLTPKDEIDESAGGTANSQIPQQMRERLDDLEDMVVTHDGTLSELREMIGERESEIEELRDRADRQEAVLYDLIDVVQALGSASDWEEFAAGFEAVQDHGSDAYPFEWDGETLDFKAERFE